MQVGGGARIAQQVRHSSLLVLVRVQYLFEYSYPARTSTRTSPFFIFHFSFIVSLYVSDLPNVTISTSPFRLFPEMNESNMEVYTVVDLRIAVRCDTEKYMRLL